MQYADNATQQTHTQAQCAHTRARIMCIEENQVSCKICYAGARARVLRMVHVRTCGHVSTVCVYVCVCYAKAYKV